MQRRNSAGCRLGQKGRKQTIITTVEPRRRKSQLQLQHRGACRAVNANLHMAFFNSAIRSLLSGSFPPSRPCLLALSLLFGLDSDSFVIEPIRRRQRCTSFQFSLQFIALLQCIVEHRQTRRSLAYFQPSTNDIDFSRPEDMQEGQQELVLENEVEWTALQGYVLEFIYTSFHGPHSRRRRGGGMVSSKMHLG